MRELAWVNGRIGELERACVSLEDRGFLFGDGVYDVARIYGGVPFRLAEHLQRLENSASKILLVLPLSRAEIDRAARKLIRTSGCREGWLYIQLTRGAAPRNHFIPAGIAPTLVMFVRALPAGLPELAAGISCITLPDERWLHCDIKSVNLLPAVLAKEKARRAGVHDAILYRQGGVVTEATTANVFAVVDGVVRTPPLSNLILPGITRADVLQILARENIAAAEKSLSLAELKRAPEIWLSSSVAEIVPVVALDGEAVGSGTPGALAQLVARQYRQLTDELRII
jgi:D-alanine transaminase